MNNASKRSLLAAAIAFIAGGSQGVIAQQNDMAESQSRIDEIIVTATKRETSLQDTSMSISVLTEKTLKNRGITSTGEFFSTVPGISVSDTTPGENRISMRGIATNIFTSGTSAISTYLDEFPITRGTRDIRLIDIDRVEVLKGPQGTLYGQAAIGGVIRYITNQPNTDTLSGGINSSVSNTKSGGTNYNVNGHLNLPITDTLAARAVLYRYDNDGFIDVGGRFPDDNANTEETVGGRLAIKWNVTDATTLDLVYLSQEIDAGASQTVTETFTPTTGSAVIIPADFSNPKSQFANPRIIEDEILNLKVSVRFDAFDLSVMGGHKEINRSGNTDEGSFLNLTNSGAISYTKNDIDVDTFEVRLVSNNSNNARFSWLAGIWYEDFEQEASRSILHEGPDTVVFGFPVTDGFDYGTTLSQQFNEELSVYGEFAIHFSEQTTLTLGYRRADVEVELPIIAASGLLNGPTLALIGQDTRVQEDVDTYRINLEHQLNDDIMLYAQASSGYRAGGFNGANPAAGIPPSEYGSDTLWNYELGARTSWLDGRLIANLTLYRIDWDDMQLRTQRFTPSGANFTVTDNVGKSKVEGLEMEVDYYVGQGLRLGMNYAYTDPVLQEDYPIGNAEAGDQLPNTAKTTYALFADYQQPLNDSLNLQVNLTHRYVDNRLAAFGSGDLLFKPFEFPDYRLTDLRIGLSHSNGINATLFANNLENEVVPTFIAQAPLHTQYRINTPRTIGISVGYSF